MNEGALAALDALLDRLALSGRTSVPGEHEEPHEYALQRGLDLLGARPESLERLDYEVRLRLALHLSPSTALRYSVTNRIPRYELVRRYLVEVLARPEDVAGDLARDVVAVLDAWDEEREGVTDQLSALARKAEVLGCASCHADLTRPDLATSIATQDPYKPYFLDVDALFQPEVDHIEAISGLGRNRQENLQVLCRLCNRGKGTGLGLGLAAEANSAGLPIDQQKAAHRAAVLYYTLRRDGGRCSLCQSVTAELTIRPRHDEGGFVRTNLHALCYECLSGVRR